MSTEEIKVPPLSLSFQVDKNGRNIRIPKSATKIDFKEQLQIITSASPYFVPLSLGEEDDAFLFFYAVDANNKGWRDLKRLGRNDKLRALYNLKHIRPFLTSRITFFLHPNNILFDDSLMPKIVYRGIRNLLAPFEMDENDVLIQHKCLAIALFSDVYSFDDLYNGSLEKVDATAFERQIKATKTLEELFQLFQEHYRKEQKETENKMILVPRRRFRFYKQMTIWLSVAGILLLSLVMYTTLFKIPYDERLLQAQKEFLAGDYSKVIYDLQKEDVEKLPYHAKYILAYSYIKVEQLSDREKEVIMKNISLKSDNSYLKYWIYNGQGDFEQAIDLAKYMDDPQLIMYGLIRKTEQVKNDPDLSGQEREEEIKRLRNELEKYTDEYDLLEEEAADEVENNQHNVEDASPPDDAAEDNEKGKENPSTKTKKANDDKKGK